MSISDEPFRMVITDFFPIKDRGIVVVGKIESGVLNKGENVIVSGEGKQLRAHVSGIEMIHYEPFKMPTATDNPGLLLRGLTHEDIKIGMIITQDIEHE